ncbi:MAG: MarR family transcriptional regulator [Crocinitomicaceae bacterium]|nr:MarR family transcriptional regulator [Flavobacteriales bacterium]NQZ34517.1 MarR family transcriptional regulator [Crocinitomicaceae bacterium]
MPEAEKKYLVDFAIRHLWHKISRMYNQKANQHGMTMSIGFILLNIDKEGTPSTQLGPKMGMEPTSLSRTLKTMEEKGLIRRESGKVDKRKVLIFLTEEGLEKRTMTRDVVYDFNNSLMESIPKGKLKTFFEVAEKLDASVDLELSKIQLKSSNE